jgi:alpha-L-rhamnosidase
MEDIRSQIGAAGGKPIPCMIAPGKRIAGEAKLDWGIAMIYLPWYSYLHYGDLTLAKSHFSEMKDFIDYMFTFRNEKGIIENGMGDWCPPRWDRQTNPGAMECHPFISANAYFYDGLKIMQEFAKLLGEKEYAQFVKKEADNIKQSFNSEFLAEIETGKKWYGSQTATVMALQFGMVPESKKEMVLQGLKHDIEITHKGHHSTGIHGNRYIYSVLCDEREENLSYSVLRHPEFPSQAYILNSGLTTWPERQWEWDSAIEWDRSLNHPMQAGFAAFFHETVAGIKPLKDSPGFKEFVIKPGLTDKLDYAQAATESPYGTIKSHWISKSEAFVLNVDIPVNSSANIVMRTGTVENISIAGKNQRYIRDHLVGTKHDKTTLRLGSGSYTIEIKK